MGGRRSNYNRRRRFGLVNLSYGGRAPQLLDSGDDAPLTEKGRLWWRLGLIVLIGLIVFLVAITR